MGEGRDAAALDMAAHVYRAPDARSYLITPARNIRYLTAGQYSDYGHYAGSFMPHAETAVGVSGGTASANLPWHRWLEDEQSRY